MIRRWAPILVTASALVLAACGDGDGESAMVGFQRDPAPEMGDVVFTDYASDPAGAPFAVAAEPGGLLVLYFGFLSCPDVCPLTMSDLGTAYAELDDDQVDRITTGFVSVDPERDEGAEIADYLGVFFDDYVALRSEDGESLSEAVARLGVTYEIEDHEPGDEQYDVAHTAVTYVIDDEGTVVWEIPFGVEPEEIRDTLDGLLDDVAAA